MTTTLFDLATFTVKGIAIGFAIMLSAFGVITLLEPLTLGQILSTVWLSLFVTTVINNFRD